MGAETKGLSLLHNRHGREHVSDKLDFCKHNTGIPIRNNIHYNLITNEGYLYKFYTEFIQSQCQSHCLLDNHGKTALIFTVIKQSQWKNDSSYLLLKIPDMYLDLSILNCNLFCFFIVISSC